MSMYYTYYLGYWDDDGKIVPLGPYDDEGNLHELFSYNYHTDISIHEGFDKISFEHLSEKFIQMVRSDYDFDKDEEIEDLWRNTWWGYMDFKDVVGGIFSIQQFIKTGYWETDELLEFLSKSRAEQEEILYFGGLSDPLPPAVYAAKVSNDPEVAKKYMFYAICDTNTDDYYRYLAHIKCVDLIDDWSHKGRKYVIFYSFS